MFTPSYNDTQADFGVYGINMTTDLTGINNMESTANETAVFNDTQDHEGAQEYVGSYQ